MHAHMRGRSVALALALTLPACVSALDADEPRELSNAAEARHAAYLAKVADVFAQSADAFERMVAASLLGDPDVATLARNGLAAEGDIARLRDALVVGALQDAGDDPLVWWSAVQDCPAASPAVCDRDVALARLRQIEPHNALVWLSALPSTAEAERVDLDLDLTRAAAATRFDVHAVERIVRLVDAFARVEPDAAWIETLPDDPAAVASPASASALAAVGVALAESLPPMSALTQQCRSGDAPLAASRRDACEAIAHTLSDASDSMIGAMLGTGLRLQLARTAEERTAAIAARRDLLWLSQASGELQAILETDGELVADHLVRWRVPGATELSALRSLLIENGLSLQAPAAWGPSGHWLPEGEAARPRVR